MHNIRLDGAACSPLQLNKNYVHITIYSAINTDQTKFQIQGIHMQLNSSRHFDPRRLLRFIQRAMTRTLLPFDKVRLTLWMGLACPKRSITTATKTH